MRKSIITTVFILLVIIGKLHSFGTEKLKYSFAEKGLNYDLSLYVPESYDPIYPTPVILALHPYQGNSDSMRDMLESIGYDENAIIACPDLNNAVVPTDFSEIVYAAISHVAEMYNVDDTRIALAGYQWGGGLAVLMGLNDPVLFRGIIAIAPEVSLDYITKEMWDNKNKIPMGFILGENDDYYNPVHQLIQEFQMNGALMKFIYKPGVEHGGDSYWGTHEFDLDVESIYTFLFKDNQSASYLINSTSHDFDVVDVGDSTIFKCTVRNTGIKTLSNFNLSFDLNEDGVFSIIDNIKDRIIKTKDTFSFNVLFKPKETKEYSGKIIIQPDTLASIKQSIELAGKGYEAKGIFAVNTPLIKFDTLVVNKAHMDRFAIMNDGDAPYKVVSMQIEGDPHNVFKLDKYNFPLIIDIAEFKYISVTFTPPSPGKYTGQIKIMTDIDNIPFYLDLVGYAKDETGIEDFLTNSDDIQVFPNPVKDNLFFKPGILKGTLKIVDISGSTIAMYNIMDYNNGILSISMNDYPPGMYYLIVENEGRRFFKSIIKQ